MMFRITVEFSNQPLNGFLMAQLNTLPTKIHIDTIGFKFFISFLIYPLLYYRALHQDSPKLGTGEVIMKLQDIYNKFTGQNTNPHFHNLLRFLATIGLPMSK